MIAIAILCLYWFLRFQVGLASARILVINDIAETANSSTNANWSALAESVVNYYPDTESIIMNKQLRQMVSLTRSNALMIINTRRAAIEK